jgi:hypothetical protein
MRAASHGTSARATHPFARPVRARRSPARPRRKKLAACSRSGLLCDALFLEPGPGTRPAACWGATKSALHRRGERHRRDRDGMGRGTGSSCGHSCVSAVPARQGSHASSSTRPTARAPDATSSSPPSGGTTATGHRAARSPRRRLIVVSAYPEVTRTAPSRPGALLRSFAWHPWRPRARFASGSVICRIVGMLLGIGSGRCLCRSRFNRIVAVQR